MESQREPNALRGQGERAKGLGWMDGWMADTNGVENQNQRPFYVGCRARVNSLICLMVDREQSLSPDPYIPPHFIWKSADPSLHPRKILPHARTLGVRAYSSSGGDENARQRGI